MIIIAVPAITVSKSVRRSTADFVKNHNSAIMAKSVTEYKQETLVRTSLSILLDTKVAVVRLILHLLTTDETIMNAMTGTRF